MKLVIQIPCLNEEKDIAQTLRDLPKTIEGVDTIEVLIIDDGSEDNTSLVAREQGVKHFVRFAKRRGLAKAFNAGLDAALRLGADIIVNTDADGQYKGEDIPRLIKPVLEGKADIVIGNRDIDNVRQFSWIKKKLQRLGTWVVRNISGVTLSDATTGFRAYSKEAALRLNIISNYTYTLESIIQAEHKNLVIDNIIISTNEVKRPSRLFKSIPEYIKRSIVTIIRVYAMFNPMGVFMRLGSLVSLAGFLLGCRFLYYYLLGHGDGKLQSLLLAAVLLIIGFQIFVIGLLADLVSANRRLIEDVLLRIKRSELKDKGPLQ